MKKSIVKLLLWAPRVIALFHLGFLFLLSLDVFEEGASFTDVLVGLFMHNLPALGLVVALTVAWMERIFGGILFMALAGVFWFAFGAGENVMATFLMTLVPATLGLLFILQGFLLRNSKK
jgi:hypothetical protein